jgi:hypothetical protein
MATFSRSEEWSVASTTVEARQGCLDALRIRRARIDAVTVEARH